MWTLWTTDWKFATNNEQMISAKMQCANWLHKNRLFIVWFHLVTHAGSLEHMQVRAKEKTHSKDKAGFDYVWRHSHSWNKSRNMRMQKQMLLSVYCKRYNWDASHLKINTTSFLERNMECDVTRYQNICQPPESFETRLKIDRIQTEIDTFIIGKTKQHEWNHIHIMTWHLSLYESFVEIK